jgi:hypothetical protein
MADSPAFQSATPATLPAGVAVSTEEVTTLNGGAVAAQHVQRFLAAFRTADGTAVDLPGDAANGLDVDVTRVQGTVAVTGPLTDTQLRASAVPVSGTVTTGGLTDAQLRASAVPVSGTVTASGPLTDTQLRAAAVPVSGTFFQGTQPVSAASLPLPSGAATEATLDTRTGALTETAPATDTASSGLNGRLQRIAQRITSLIGQIPATLGQKTKANSLAVTLASDQDALPITDNAGSLTVDGTVGATQSGTWTVQPGNTANTTAWKVDGSAVTQPVSGTVSVNALPAGTNNIGDVDVLTLPAIPTGANVVGQVGLEPRTSGGLSISRTLSAASTNATSVKASAGQVFGYYLFNANAATRYLKLYNKASSPTVGTDTPVATIPIPAGAAANVEFTQGVAFATGIALALTTGIADADTGAVAANEVVVNLFYK